MEKELMNFPLFNQMMEQKIWTPDQKLLALSWKQPYAELMLHGKIETRTWNTNYRGWVLICASKKGYDPFEVWEISGEKQAIRITNVIGRNADHHLNGYKSGIAFAIGYLVQCYIMRPDDQDSCYVKYWLPKKVTKVRKDLTIKTVTKRLYCHVYDYVQAIEPFPWKGSIGWKEVTPEIKNQIKFK